MILAPLSLRAQRGNPVNKVAPFGALVIFTGLLRHFFPRNDTAGAVKQNRAVRKGCGKDEVHRRHMHKKTTSLRAQRGNPGDNVVCSEDGCHKKNLSPNGDKFFYQNSYLNFAIPVCDV